MAQSRLTRVAIACAVLVFGAAAEAAAPATTPALTVADYLVGALYAVAGAWLVHRQPGTGALSLLTALAWFAGTLSGADSTALAAIGSAALLLYRGPLLGLLLAGRPRALAVAAWLACLPPLSVAGALTAVTAALTAGVTAVRARRSGADRRPALVAAAVAALALNAVWSLAALALTSRTPLTVLNDVAVLSAGAVALWTRTEVWERQAAGRLVIELAADGRLDRPLTAQLARALADPALQLRYSVPGVGWVDEGGRPTSAPGTRELTRAVVPGGAEVVLMHGGTGRGDSRLSAAAAAAAALALDSVRLEAAIKARAAEVRAARQRLLTAADAERRDLEQRLTEGPLAELRRVDRLLGAHADLRGELQAAIAELTDLGHGLFPPALTRADLAGALADMAQRSPVPVSIDISGDPSIVTDGQHATIWFVCSEALANIARHSGATQAAVRLAVEATAVVIEVRDNGRGGATANRGLRGLADRVDAGGGSFALDSPPGGPTIVRTQIPI